LALRILGDPGICHPRGPVFLASVRRGGRRASLRAGAPPWRGRGFMSRMMTASLPSPSRMAVRVVQFTGVPKLTVSDVCL